MYYTDDVIEQSTEQKLLLHLLPLLCLVAMAGTLNQLSLQYAASALGQALDLDATQLGIAENLFCLGYLAASLPAAWLLLRFGPRLWISGAVLATGCVALAQALVWDAGSLYAVRLLLGVAEAGLPPAMVFYLMQWMPEQHRPKGIVALVAAAALVPLFAGELSQFILWIAGWFGFDDWRCLFVVEGLPTLWLGLHVPGRTPEAPAEVNWLPPSERLWLLDRLGQSAAAGAAMRFADGLRSVAAWKLAAVQGIVGLVGGSLGMWVPLAMQQSGYVRPGIGFAIMLIAAAIGMGSAVGAGLVWHERAQWRRVLIVGLAVAGVCLGIAAALPFGDRCRADAGRRSDDCAGDAGAELGHGALRAGGRGGGFRLRLGEHGGDAGVFRRRRLGRACRTMRAAGALCWRWRASSPPGWCVASTGATRQV